MVRVLTTKVSADNDNVIRSRDIKAGIKAHGGIADTRSVVRERKGADGGVATSRGVAEQCLIAAGRVLDAGGVIEERLETKRVVSKSCRVALKRVLTHGVVSAAAKGAGAVGILERSRANGHISAVMTINPNDGV